WASESLPTEDNNVEEILILCRKFLVHKNLLNWANHYRELAFKKAKRARETYLPEPLTSTKTLDYIKYNNQTPAKPRRPRKNEEVNNV
ncbi:50_t:CDS:2, partial [Paraglomus brasilianum]